MVKIFIAITFVFYSISPLNSAITLHWCPLSKCDDIFSVSVLKSKFEIAKFVYFRVAVL